MRELTQEEMDYLRDNIGKLYAHEIAENLGWRQRVLSKAARQQGISLYKRGEHHPRARVSNAQVAEARKLRESGMTGTAIAREMGLPVCTVNSWLTGANRWA